jgi:kumamolisin
LSLLLTWLPGLWAAPAQAAERQVVHARLPAVVTNAAPVRRSPRWKRLDLTIGLPLRDRPGLTNLLQELYDPNSRNFRHYLTPDQFAQRFGPTEKD